MSAEARQLNSRYKEALAWLFGTQLFGIKLGLESIHRLLEALDLPAKEQRIIHVAGTNGKGSVCAMIDSICRAQGYRTGLFTSPHLITYRERIRVNGAMISAEASAEGLELIRELVREWEPHPTFFEITTALALWHFKREACEIVVLETGMGGRLDATNAVAPVTSVITPIDYDHQKWLGSTLTEIASEKAGIIKPGTPVVSAQQANEAAKEVIRSRAEEREAPLEFVSGKYETGPAALAGEHQQENAALAVAALRAAKIEVDDDAVRRGLATVSWPARFQRWSERIVVDGAHNAAGARVLAKTWRSVFGDERATIILAILRDKDAAAIVRALEPIAEQFILPQSRAERAMPPNELMQIVREVAPGVSVSRAELFSAATGGTQTGRILVTGSLHFAGEVLATLEGAPAAYEECLQ